MCFGVRPGSPKCNFLICPCKPKWIGKKNTRLKHQSEQFVTEKTYKGSGPQTRLAQFEEFWERKNQFVGFPATQNCSDWCLSLVFFLSIHFGLQGRIIKLHFGDIRLTSNKNYL